MFGVAGLRSVFAASIVARLPTGAIGVLLLLRTQETTGSYAAGGAVAAAYGLGTGFGAPLLGRVVDRRGQRAVLVPGACAGAAALAAFAALPADAPLPAAVAIAAVAGVSLPPLSSCLRALLSSAVAPERRHRAFAIDSTAFELVYIAGPLVLVGLVGAWSLRAAIAASAVLTLVGTLAFAAARLSRDARGGDPAVRDLAGPLRDPGVRTLLATMALFGLSVAGLEVGLAAFADEQGSRSAVGYLLALSGVGSLAGGLLAARATAPADPARRLSLLLLAVAVLAVPMGLVGSLAAMAVAVTVASVGIAPALALLFGLMSDVAPGGTVTEAMTWLSSAINAGVAGGAAAAGALIEARGSAVVLFSFAGYCALAAGVVALRASVLRP